MSGKAFVTHSVARHESDLFVEERIIRTMMEIMLRIDPKERATQFGLLLEKHVLKKSDEDYADILDPQLLHIKLDESSESFIFHVLTFCYERSKDPAYLWAIGKAHSSITLPWFKKEILPQLARMPAEHGWQALIALENIIDDGITHKDIRPVREQLRTMAANHGGRRKELALRILDTTRNI